MEGDILLLDLNLLFKLRLIRIDLLALRRLYLVGFVSCWALRWFTSPCFWGNPTSADISSDLLRVSNSGDTLGNLSALHSDDLCLQVLSLLIDLVIENSSWLRLSMRDNSFFENVYIVHEILSGLFVDRFEILKLLLQAHLFITNQIFGLLSIP